MTTRSIYFRVTVELDEDAARLHEDDNRDWMPDTIRTLTTAMRTICEDNLDADLVADVRVRQVGGVGINYEPRVR